MLKEADFYYYACDSLEALPADRPLKIDLKELIDNWQIGSPVSNNDLINKIFNKVENIQENKVINKESKTPGEKQEQNLQSTQIQPDSGFINKQSDIDWELVNPLLVSGAPGDNAINSIGSAWEENAHSTQDLRSLTTGREWQRKLRDLLLILIMLAIALIVVLCVGWLLMNSPSSEVLPRHFPIHIIKHNPKEIQNYSHPAQR